MININDLQYLCQIFSDIEEVTQEFCPKCLISLHPKGAIAISTNDGYIYDGYKKQFYFDLNSNSHLSFESLISDICNSVLEEYGNQISNMWKGKPDEDIHVLYSINWAQEKLGKYITR